MGLRELLILLLILAIVGVILRGLFVAIRARRGQLRVQLDKNVPQYDPEELTLSELPNGGARSVERSFAQVVQQNSEFSAKDRRKISSGEHAIPVLMDTVGADDEDDEELPRQSSVATARESARQKHMQGHRTAASSAQRSEGVSATSVAHQDANLSITPKDEPDDEALDDDYEEDDFDDDYPDPLDAHVFADEDDDDDEDDEAPTMHAYGDFRDANPDDTDEDQDDEDDEDQDDEDDEDEDDAPSEDSVDPDGEGFDDEEDDYDEAPSEDSVDPDAFDDFDDVEENADPEGWEDEDDAEDEEIEQEEIDAVEFDEIYGDESVAPRRAQDDDFDEEDDDDGWDEETAEQEKEVSAPRRWFKWAGDKISNMGAEHDEPVRERDFHGEGRAEPVIGLDDFDIEADEQAPRTPEPAPKSTKAPLDKSRQAQLFAEEPVEDEIEEQAPEPVAAPAPEPARAAPARPVLQEPEAPKEYSEVLVINVVAKPNCEFIGIDLLPALLASGLRFGEMSIFHRHFDADPSSPVIFSVANMVNPGTFDLNQINEFATRGVCFFMTLPNAATSMQAFNIMLEAAQSLRIALDGDLKDDNRSVMTAQTIEHYRQRVLDFDLRQLRQPK